MEVSFVAKYPKYGNTQFLCEESENLRFVNGSFSVQDKGKKKNLLPNGHFHL